ncbi:helix-turn-helix domain-containing transcriptional regulator [Pseudomonas syringae]|uniref:helix-turn-helix domain-containing transcriptional regulator n=1 Tax=Pseudomonas syringae TaxID=317 RepID=UPI003F768D91
MKELFFDYDPADSLVDSEAIAVFLADAYDTGDAAFIAEAMAVVARAKIRIDAAAEAQRPSSCS